MGKTIIGINEIDNFEINYVGMPHEILGMSLIQFVVQNIPLSRDEIITRGGEIYIEPYNIGDLAIIMFTQGPNGILFEFGAALWIRNLKVEFKFPGKLDASYIDKDGTKKVPVMLHRALFGSLERFIGILIENYAGKFPFWISPLQTMVIPISEEFNDYAVEVSKKIRIAGISSNVDLKNNNLNYKIRDHSLAKIPVLLICGKKEVDTNSVTIRRLDSNKQENMELKTFLKTFSALNKASSN